MFKVFIVICFLFFLLNGCSQERTSEILPENSRFKVMETYAFLGNKAQEVLDTETGIRYLYVWEGGSNGGPAITRLWEK